MIHNICSSRAPQRMTSVFEDELGSLIVDPLRIFLLNYMKKIRKVRKYDKLAKIRTINLMITHLKLISNIGIDGSK